MRNKLKEPSKKPLGAKIKKDKPKRLTKVSQKETLASQMRKGKVGTKVLGEAGESVAAYYFKTKGYRVIGRNIRFKRGEVDILAIKDDVIRVIEVKTILIRSDGAAVTQETMPFEGEIQAAKACDVNHETSVQAFEPEHNFTEAKISRLKSVAAEIVAKYPFPLLHMLNYDGSSISRESVLRDGGMVRVHIEGLAVRIYADRSTIKSIRVKHIEDLVS